MKIGVIGLGYVGLPLARLFATQYDVVGFDLIKERVKNLQNGDDHTGEVEPEQLKAVLRRFLMAWSRKAYLLPKRRAWVRCFPSQKTSSSNLTLVDTQTTVH